ncbi:hypothetical protein F4859DRAFT_78256 [Xylaria cf. heliscus]|nr:hypothetical protein F4859DRAFT_78256 [Xylaria cf. heliscus]
MSAVSQKQDGITAQQAAAQVTYTNNPPTMSAPPKAYAAPVMKVDFDDDAIQRRVTPVRQLRREPGFEPEWVNCPFCKQMTTVRRVAEPSDEAKCCIVCCGLVGFLLLCFPRAGEWLENIDIHCGSCDRHIATISPDDEVKLARVSNRPPLPAAMTTQKR